MKYAIFSDMHGNLEAFRRVLELLGKEGELKYFCAGDIVGYGADPSACIDIARRLDPVIVCGNHDWASVDMISAESFNDYAKKAVLWTASALKPEEKDYLRSLSLTYTDDELTLVHGTIMEPEAFHYVFDADTASVMLREMPTKIAFIGHSHIPGIFVDSGGRLEYLTGKKVKVSDQKRYLVNVGSVGQPRDGDKRASFCIWDRDEGTLEIRRTDYDIASAQKKIVDAGLPEFLAGRLGEGI